MLLGAHHKWIIEKTSKKNEDVGIFLLHMGVYNFLHAHTFNMRALLVLFVVTESSFDVE